MVHVRFNDKVECHQYDTSTTGTGTEMVATTKPADNANIEIRPEQVDSAIVDVGPSRINYDPTFLRTLRESPLANTCPDVVKNASERAGWLPVKPLNSMTLNRQRGVRQQSVFMRPQSNSHNYNEPRRTLVPWNDSDSRNGRNHPARNMDIYAPLQPPIGHGSNRFNSQQGNSSNRFFMQDYAQRNDAKTSIAARDMHSMEQHDPVPEWYTTETSRNDFIDLVGLDGVAEHEAADENKNGKKTSFESNDSPKSSPPAKSTPAKVGPTESSNDAQRNRRFDIGRSNQWQNNSENPQNTVAPQLHDFFKYIQPTSNFNFGGPVLRAEDLEAKAIDNIKFRQMIAQLPPQQYLNNQPNILTMLRNSSHVNSGNEIPNANAILEEIKKILHESTDPAFRRPEVRQIIRNIVDAVIPPHHILNLMKNPLTEPHDRETITAVINLLSKARTNAAIALKNKMPPTQPSQAELQAHTAAIMQNAIIKSRIDKLIEEFSRIPNNPSMHQSFRSDAIGRGFPNQRNMTGLASKYTPHIPRGQHQQDEASLNMPCNNQFKRWFSPTLLDQAAAGQLPSISQLREAMRLEEYQRSIKENLLKGKENQIL